MKTPFVLCICALILSPLNTAGQDASTPSEIEEAESPQFDPPDDVLEPLLNTPDTSTGKIALRIGSGAGILGASALIISGIAALLGEIDEDEQDFQKGVMVINAGVLTLGLSGIFFIVSLQNP